MDLQSGLDTRETPGWGVADLYTSARIGRHVELRLGIDNLFDRTCAQHLNKSSEFDATQAQVNEPGRSVWMQVQLRL